MTHILEGTTLAYINAANWADVKVDDYLAGGSLLHTIRNLTLTSDAMPVSEFNYLFSLEGKVVTLQTTDYSNRNTFKTYYGVEFQRLVGRQESINVFEVQAEFKVIVGA